MEKEPEHLGCTIVVIKDNKVLLGKRLNAYKAGHYGCPGGRLELAEPLIECARRELLEETGAVATKLEYVGVVRELQDGYNFVHFTFVCTEWSGEITVTEPNKCKSWNFYSVDQLPVLILPAHRAGINLAINPHPRGYIDLLNI